MRSPRFYLEPVDNRRPWDGTQLVDGHTGEVLGVDCGEPEDQTFNRDWDWVLTSLNKLNDELQEVKNACQGNCRVWNLELFALKQMPNTDWWYLCQKCTGKAKPTNWLGTSVMFTCTFCKRSHLRRVDHKHRGSVNGFPCHQVVGVIDV